MYKYEPKEIEKKVLNFWKKKKIYKKQKDMGKKGSKFYWLCGPPYTSGKFHVGHFWNYVALKDPFLRYKRMNKFNVWDRGGWDMHGLPTSWKVMAKLKLKSKEDIENYGVEKFVKECEKFSIEMMEKMNEDYKKWGVWYDHENAYQPIKNEFMEGVWWCIKKAHENGYLYKGKKVMAWCPESETAAAKHELEYKEVSENSIYLKFKLKNEKNTYLLVWTTTPWTIPHNLAVMANPDITYVYAKSKNETWILAEDLVKEISKITNINLKVLKKVKGKKLEGLKYESFLEDEIPKLKDFEKKYDWAFKVLLSDKYVDTKAGTGLVHCAPGCGPEDQEVGNEYKLPAFNEVDKKGHFKKNMGLFKGLRARFDDEKFTEHFKNKNAVIAVKKYVHEYPFHERSKCDVIFRTTKQWFFSAEKLKEKMIEWNKETNWIPEWAGSKTFNNWLENLRDINITRQRYWGTPIPIWECDSCKNFVVIESLKELKKYSGKRPRNMHKPWIDKIEFKCDKCKKGNMKRIPDIGDVWLDAGCVSWISLYYPQKKKDFEEYWPADFILEAKDQIRGWFNLLFNTAAVTKLGKPFKNCYMTGWINDSKGRKMSKSLGNVIDPYEVIDKYGVDTVRFYMMGAAQPGYDMNYNHRDIEIKFRNLKIFWNLYNYLSDFVKTNKLKIPKKAELNLEEKYILSRTNNTLKKVTEMYDNYRLNEIPKEIEDLFLDISRFYIKTTREKSVTGSIKEKEVIAYTLFKSLLKTLKMFGTIAPFICEQIYQNLKKEFKLKEESLNLFEWPKTEEDLIDEELEDSIKNANDIITAFLSIRDKKRIGLRWPLQKLLILTKDKEGLELTSELIKNQCNVKEIEIINQSPDWIKSQVKIHYDKLGKKFKDKVPKIVGTLIQMSPDSIESKLKKSNNIEISVDEEKFKIDSEDIYIEEELPEEWETCKFENGTIYVYLKQNQELISEGFTREIIRRIQGLRKKANLKKTDKATAEIKVDNELKDIINSKKEDIEKWTNTKIMVDTDKEISQEVYEKEKIQGKYVEIGLKAL